MNIVTLTTDLGLRDHFVAAIKGQLLSKNRDLQIIDITHEIDPFDLGQTAYYLNNVFRDFPEGTIHYIGVDSIPRINIGNETNNRYPTIVELKGHYFIGCDNGIFSLLNDYETTSKIIRIDDFSAKFSLRHPTRYIYIPAIIALSNGKAIDELGEKVDKVNRVILPQPTLEVDLVKGAVMHIDHYGNVIVNITEKLFNEIGKKNPFTIYFKRSQYFIETISKNYHDVPTGEKLALFNENGFLEIAINKGVRGNGGGADSLLGLKVNDIIRVEFHPKGSKDNFDSLFPV